MHEPAAGPLVDAFPGRLRTLGVCPGDTVLVALSGGADSVVLLHLLRFGTPGVRVAAAHFDHAMRAGSAADARWVAGLCRAWAVPLHTARAAVPLGSEAEARDARYTFLRAVQRDRGARWLATAHHADDQAETVLLRIARGTGVGGLSGIPEHGPDGLIRPLLPFPRDALRAHAASSHLRWRTDPTNRSVRPLRNRLRMGLLRAGGAPLRERLVRLAKLARGVEDQLAVRDAAALRAVCSRDGEALLLEREALRVYDSAVATRLLRRVLRRFGTVPDRTGTRTALQFISAGRSGSSLVLPGGRVCIRLEFGRARVEAAAPGLPDVVARVDGPAGEAGARLGGRALRLAWRTGASPAEDEAALDPAAGPYTVRGWSPGDRVRARGVTRTLKKLFNQARVPRSRRSRLAVVCDAAGSVQWVAGLTAPPRHAPGPALILSILDA